MILCTLFGIECSEIEEKIAAASFLFGIDASTLNLLNTRKTALSSLAFLLESLSTDWAMELSLSVLGPD